jgi:hypothetical protein
MSVEAVEATMITSCRLGGKSFNRRKKWCGGERLRPNGLVGSEIFWKRKLEGGVRVTIWKIDDGASLLLKFDGVWARRNMLFSIQVMEETIRVSLFC